MKRKFYLFLSASIAIAASLISLQATAQVNQLYFRETFEPAGPSADPGATSTPTDYVGSAGTWRFYGLYITTGTGCTNGAVSADNRHIRSTNNASITDTAYIISPLVSSGVNEVRFVRSRNNRRYTIYKTTETDINTTNWVLASVIPKVVGYPVTLCQDSAVIVNDATAKRIMIKFERAVNCDIDSLGLTSVNIVAPVKFNGITAQQTNGFTKVSWSILTETNTQRYEIERSADGRSFATVGTVDATNAGKYSWIDNAALSGNSYYRIKGVDKDGQLTYSTIVRITSAKGIAELIISPNPVQGHLLNIQLSSAEKGIYTLQLHNGAGALVLSKTISNEGGSISQSVELPISVVKGIYQLQLTNGSTRLNKAIVVQ